MECNVGKTDMTLRLLLGAFIVILGVIYENPLGIIGFIPLITGMLRWCPIYTLLGKNTCEQDELPMKVEEKVVEEKPVEKPVPTPEPEETKIELAKEIADEEIDLEKVLNEKKRPAKKKATKTAKKKNKN